MKKVHFYLRTFSYWMLAAWLFFFISACSSGEQSKTSTNVTSDIIRLGNPLQDKYPNGEAIYSRNIWDMQLFADKIFLGAGNSSNQGPSQNSGPVPIIAYNLAKNKFDHEEVIADEQIDLYKVMDNKLYVPGHDATQNWKWGNFYQRTLEGKWSMYRNVPNALHLYDLIFREGKLFAGIGLYEGAAVGITSDMGKNWEIIPLGKSRVYSFLPVGDKLLALKKFKRTSKTYFSVAQYLQDGTFSARFDISMFKMFPDTHLKYTYGRVVRVLPVGERTLYIGGYKYNDHQVLPFGLYIASFEENRFKAERIKLKKGLKPRDIIMRGTKLYLLAQEEENDSTIIRVLETSMENLLEWKELFHFNYPTFARSFERTENAFYFGMGCDIDPQKWRVTDMPVETGDILKIIYKEQ